MVLQIADIPDTLIASRIGVHGSHVFHWPVRRIPYGQGKLLGLEKATDEAEGSFAAGLEKEEEEDEQDEEEEEEEEEDE